jgi:hypothetical protein
MPERERQKSGDDTDDGNEDVEMNKDDQDEIDRLVRESKKATGEESEDDVEMSDARPSRPQTGSGSGRERTAPDPKVAFGSNTKEQQEEEEDERVARNKNEMKNKEKPESGCHCGLRGRLRHPSSTASIWPRMRTQSIARQERWMA